MFLDYWYDDRGEGGAWGRAYAASEPDSQAMTRPLVRCTWYGNSPFALHKERTPH
jgi:hypothetical protein